MEPGFAPRPLQIDGQGVSRSCFSASMRGFIPATPLVPLCLTDSLRCGMLIETPIP